MTKRINMFIWGPEIPNIIRDLPERIQKENPDIIDLFCFYEHEIAMYGRWSSDPSYNIIEKFAAEKELNIVFGCFSNEYTLTRNDIPENANIYFWGEFWCTHTRFLIEHSSVIDNFKLGSMTSPFISLNNQPHQHRCKMIDELARRNLIDRGKISWHYPDVDYSWKYWKNPKRLILDNRYVEIADSYRTLLGFDDMSNSFMNLIAESTVKVPFLTEKTWTAIFLKKPFLMLNAPMAHKHLNDLGFLNYDEIFDYSFDSDSDLDSRIMKIINNVESIISADLDKLYKLLYPKIIHNFNRAIELSKDINIMPKMCKEYYDDSTIINNRLIELYQYL